VILLYASEGKRKYGIDDTKLPRVRKAWEFMIVLEGTCTRVTREKNTMVEERVEGPMMYVSDSESLHGWGGTAKDACTVLVFLFDVVDYSLQQTVGRSGYRRARFPAEKIPELRKLYARCILARKTRPVYLREIYHIISLELSVFFLSLLPKPKILVTTDFAKHKVLESIAWYRAQLKNQPTIKEAADAVHVSSGHLRRLFHKVHGTSPQQIFSRIQFETAKELMLYPALSIENIGENSGFGSASAFSRAFKLEFGISPKTYRSQLTKEE
jgi:AraC-like DNA-binding protein